MYVRPPVSVAIGATVAFVLTLTDVPGVMEDQDVKW